MTAPPAGALEACLALLEKATPGPYEASDDSGTPCVSTVVPDKTGGKGFLVAEGWSMDDCAAAASALNLLKDHGPALLAALRLREWRPIAEAPKDGRRILVAAHGLIPYVARYETGEGWLDENSHYREPIVWRPLEPPTADDLARALEEGE